jgi:hypothetical protein
MNEVNAEMSKYTDLPRYYDFGTPEQKQKFLLNNMQKIYLDIQNTFPAPQKEEKPQKEGKK